MSKVKIKVVSLPTKSLVIFFFSNQEVKERGLRPLFLFAHPDLRAEKAVCRRYAGKPTPRRRVGRLVCAARTRARKAERGYPIAVPLGKGGGETSPLPAATRRPAG